MTRIWIVWEKQIYLISDLKFKTFFFKLQFTFVWRKIKMMLSELSSAYQTIVFLIISGGKDDLTPQILQDIANILTLGTFY